MNRCRANPVEARCQEPRIQATLLSRKMLACKLSLRPTIMRYFSPCAYGFEHLSEINPAYARARFGRLIGGGYRQWRRQMDLSVKDLGLSDATRAPLLALYAADAPMRQKELAQALLLDTSSLVRVLEQLRGMALLDWESDPTDRRAKCIALTPLGRKTASRILARSLEIERSILVDLSADELAGLRGALEKISQRFDVL